MLDQNTDRMWYVIGAVLVGAAIILIANGALPQMFASATDSFDSVSGNAITGISKIGNLSKSYIIDSQEEKYSNGPHHIDYELNMEELNNLAGERVIITFEAKSEDSSHIIDSYFRALDGKNVPNSEKSKAIKLTQDYQSFSHTFVAPDLSNYLDYDLVFRFRGNDAIPESKVNGISTNKLGFNVRNVKMYRYVVEEGD